jgi:hypothetical protein
LEEDQPWIYCLSLLSDGVHALHTVSSVEVILQVTNTDYLTITGKETCFVHSIPLAHPICSIVADERAFSKVISFFIQSIPGMSP